MAKRILSIKEIALELTATLPKVEDNVQATHSVYELIMLASSIIHARDLGIKRRKELEKGNVAWAFLAGFIFGGFLVSLL